MEALLTRYHFINSALVPTVQLKFSRFGEEDGGERSLARIK